MGASIENKIETTNNLENIKSKYIIKQITDNVPKHIFLNIIKYNKKLKDKLNININDYKKYSEKFSSIHIEIKFVEGKYGKFINILDKDEKYYRKYFDNNKEEIKRNNICQNDNVTKIKIRIDYHKLSFWKLFKDCKIFEKLTFFKFNRKDIIDMSYMFSGCSSLKYLNISKIKTDNVINMSNNTNNVIDMSDMFCG